MFTLSSCAQQGEIKEPFDIPRHVDSSDYQGEITPFKEPIVLERLSYETTSTSTSRQNNKSDTPPVSTMAVVTSSGRVEYPEEDKMAADFQLLRIESKSSASPSKLWWGNLKVSFVMDLSDNSVISRDYPSVGETPEEQEQLEKILDTVLDAFLEQSSPWYSHFERPISGENNEVVVNIPISTGEFGIDLEIALHMTFVGTTTYLNYDAIVVDMSGTSSGSNNVHAQIEGYAVISARDGAMLFSKLVSRGYEGSEHGRLLREAENVVVADRYQPLLSREESLDVAFRAYQKTDDSSSFKVFLRNDAGAWAFNARESFYSAWHAALSDCHRRSKDYEQTGNCRVYAVGDVMVWDMPGNERDAVIKAYEHRFAEQGNNLSTPRVVESSSKSVTLEKPDNLRVNAIYQFAAEHCQLFGKTSILVGTKYPEYTFECR